MYFNPLAVASHWPVPNYADPVTRGPELWILTAIFLFAATCCVAVRLYWRIFLRRWLGLDDLLVVLALVSNSIRSIAYSIFIGCPAVFRNCHNLRCYWHSSLWLGQAHLGRASEYILQ